MTTTRKRSAPAPVDAQTLPEVRLAAPSTALAELGIDVGTWKVLTESVVCRGIWDSRPIVIGTGNLLKVLWI